MSILDQLAGALGGPQQAQEQAQRFANGQANLQDPNSPDFQTWNQMVGSAPPGVTQQAFSQAAQQVDPNAYQQHITPGAGGTDPLGSLGKGALGTLAGALVSSMAQNGGSGGLGSLIGMVPGLQNTNPQQMSPQDVGALASYMQQNHPQAFGQAASQVAQQQPDLLHSLLGNKALMLAAAGVGAKILQDRAQGRTLWVNPTMTKGQVQQAMGSLLQGMQRSFPNRPLEVITYYVSGDELARMTWDPRTNQTNTVWRQ